MCSLNSASRWKRWLSSGQWKYTVQSEMEAAVKIPILELWTRRKNFFYIFQSQFSINCLQVLDETVEKVMKVKTAYSFLRVFIWTISYGMAEWTHTFYSRLWFFHFLVMNFSSSFLGSWNIAQSMPAAMSLPLHFHVCGALCSLTCPLLLTLLPFELDFRDVPKFYFGFVPHLWRSQVWFCDSVFIALVKAGWDGIKGWNGRILLKRGWWRLYLACKLWLSKLWAGHIQPGTTTIGILGAQETPLFPSEVEAFQARESVRRPAKQLSFFPCALVALP